VSIPELSTGIKGHSMLRPHGHSGFLLVDGTSSLTASSMDFSAVNEFFTYMTLTWFSILGILFAIGLVDAWIL